MSFLSTFTIWDEGYKLQCIRKCLKASCFLLLPLVVWTLVILPVLRNDRCKSLIKQWGGRRCWRSLTKTWILQYGSSWREAWAPVDQWLIEERQSWGPQSKLKVDDLPLCFDCGLQMWMAGARGHWCISPPWGWRWHSDADLENSLFTICDHGVAGSSAEIEFAFHHPAVDVAKFAKKGGNTMLGSLNTCIPDAFSLSQPPFCSGLDKDWKQPPQVYSCLNFLLLINPIFIHTALPLPQTVGNEHRSSRQRW